MPKCQFDHEDQTTECLRCGIMFAKFSHLQEAVRPIRIPTLIEEGLEATQSLQEAKEELRYRLLALPLALLAPVSL